MDEGATTLTNRKTTRPPAGPRGPVNGRPQRPRGWSNEPHHRRRRALAMVVMGAAALFVLIAIANGGGSAARHPTARGASGFFGRIEVLAGTGPGSFAAAQQAAENGAIDRTLSYTPYIQVAGSQHREIALTFDDGPGPYTPQLLSVLERENVPATFFQVGDQEKYFRDSTSQILSLGFPIGDHTETHAPMSRLSSADQKSQVLSQAAAIAKYGAPFPRLFRPPYGVWSQATLTLLRRYRMLMVLWTIDTSDYRQPGVDSIVNTVLSGARPGAIVLMHDAGGPRSQTIAAVPIMISALRSRGYRLVTVPRLLLDNPPPADQQISTAAWNGG